MNRPDISIIIPALNEERNISLVVEKLKTVFDKNRLNAEILIVDDCSDDNTLQEALELGRKFPNIRAMRKELPRGIGLAIRFGIYHAKGIVGVVVMADGVDPIYTIPLFKQKIIDEGYKLVLLSRYANHGDSRGIPFSYKFCHICHRILCVTLLGFRLKDITYAYRAFDLDYVRGLNLSSGGFEISSEMSIKTFLKKAPIYEANGRQGKRLIGTSKFRFLKHGPRYAKVLLKGSIAKVFRKWPGQDWVL